MARAAGRSPACASSMDDSPPPRRSGASPSRKAPKPGRSRAESEPGEDPNAVRPGQWAQREAYAVRAPQEAKRAEVQRSQEASERKLRELQAAKKAAGLAHVKASAGAQRLGTGAGSREDFLRALERDPRVEKAKEKRAAEEEKKRQAQLKEEERLRALAARQRVDREQDRRVNEAKERHWQVWDEAASGANRGVAAAAASGDRSGQLVGPWRSEASEFEIRRVAGGELQFRDLCGRVGFLARGGAGGAGGWEAALYQGGEELGQMRFELSGHELLTRFRTARVAAWGSAARAHRVEADRPAPTPPAAPAAPVAPARAAPPASLEPLREAGDIPGGDGRVENFRDTLIDGWQCQRCTLINHLGSVQCNACGWQPPPPQMPPAPVAQLAPKMAPQSTKETSEVLAPPPPPPPATGPERLLRWLQEQGLEEYAAAVQGEGYEDLQDLLEGDARDIDEMLTLVGAKKGHILKFRNALRRTREADQP
ncbi:unnamed protein product [Effrenium voratum]|nr:unnamed protein product [Effrenium voratum]